MTMIIISIQARIQCTTFCNPKVDFFYIQAKPISIHMRGANIQN